MKKILVLCGIVVLLSVFAGGGLSYGKVILVTVSDDEKALPIAKAAPDLVLNEVPDIAGQKCEGFTYGTFDYNVVSYSVGTPAPPIKIHKIEIEPNGVIGTHHGDTPFYACYVIAGEGELALVDKEGNLIEKINYGPEDLIIFRPNTAIHYWKNGPQKTEMLGVENVPPQ